MSIKDIFLSFCKSKIGNGEHTKFWEDIWPRDKSLVDIFPIQYNLTFSKNIIVAEVFGKGRGCIHFRRVPWGEKAQMMENLKGMCSEVKLGEHPDKLIYNLSSKGHFSVKYFYCALKMQQVRSIGFYGKS